MGPELIAALPQLGMMVGGSLLQMNAQQDAADERRQVMNRQLARDSAAQQKGAQQVLAEGQNFAPEQRQQAIQQAETQAFDQSQKDLQTGANVTGQPAAVQTSGDAGNVSADFIKGKADRAITEGTRLTSLAREIAKTRAPTLLQQTEAQRRANLAGDLSNLYGSNQQMAGATQNDAGAVEEPAYGALGSIASSIGSTWAGSKLGGMFKPVKYGTTGGPDTMGFGGVY